LKECDAVVTICDGLKEEIRMRKIPEKKIYVIPNGVDSNKFIASPKDGFLLKRYAIGSNDLVIGFVGSLYRFEGVEYIIKILPRILSQYPDVKLLIVGSGEQEEKLRQFAAQSKVEDNVIFTGKIPHKEIINYYSLIDILVYPRQKNRITDIVTPIKPLEAMALEKPVIASNVGGLKELISDGTNGILFEAENLERLVEKTLLLLADPELRINLGKQARLSILKKRDWAQIIPNYSQIYQAASANKK
jgi:glycosyltransferase involved in cell wall biosynthesis